MLCPAPCKCDRFRTAALNFYNFHSRRDAPASPATLSTIFVPPLFVSDALDVLAQTVDFELFSVLRNVSTSQPRYETLC